MERHNQKNQKSIIWRYFLILLLLCCIATFTIRHTAIFKRIGVIKGEDTPSVVAGQTQEESRVVNRRSRWNDSLTDDMYNDPLRKCNQTECYNVLYLTSRDYFIDFMDRFLDFRYNATKLHPNSGTVLLWVVDRMWFGYNTSLTIAENIKGRFGDVEYFHIVHVESLGGDKIAEQVREITQLSAITAVTICLHESYNQSKTRNQITSINASIVYFAYANDAIHYSAGEGYS